MEYIIPLLAGVLCSIYLCAFTGNLFGFFTVPTEPEIFRTAEENFVYLLSTREILNDAVLEYYRNPEYTEWVVDFFTALCSDRKIAQAILANTDKFDVSPALAFALCWEESRFFAMAVNRNNRNGSVDRGLFQLNNRSFPNLDIINFFDIDTNVYYGVGHLRYCLDTGGTQVSALAMYNAGANRVRTTGAPASTLNYISRILNNKSRIESLFHSRLIKEEERRLAEKDEKTTRLLFNR